MRSPLNGRWGGLSPRRGVLPFGQQSSRREGLWDPPSPSGMCPAISPFFPMPLTLFWQVTVALPKEIVDKGRWAFLPGEWVVPFIGLNGRAAAAAAA